MRQIWTQGDERMDRTGVGTRAVFGAQLRLDLSQGRVPLLSTKRSTGKPPRASSCGS
jgi:thymidylate synthase